MVESKSLVSSQLTKEVQKDLIISELVKKKIEAAERVFIATRVLTFIAVRKETVLISSDVEQGSRCSDTVMVDIQSTSDKDSTWTMFNKPWLVYKDIRCVDAFIAEM